MLGSDVSDSWSYYARSEIGDSDEVVDAVSENTETMMELNEEYKDTMRDVAQDCSQSYKDIEYSASEL